VWIMMKMFNGKSGDFISILPSVVKQLIPCAVGRNVIPVVLSLKRIFSPHFFVFNVFVFRKRLFPYNRKAKVECQLPFIVSPFFHPDDRKAIRLKIVGRNESRQQRKIAHHSLCFCDLFRLKCSAGAEFSLQFSHANHLDASYLEMLFQDIIELSRDITCVRFYWLGSKGNE